jgi:hypothetical protein
MIGHSGRRGVLLLGLWAALGSGAVAQAADTLAADERVVLFPTCAVPLSGGGWRVPVHGWVFEPEHDSPARLLALDAFAEALELPPEDARANALFQERAWPFVVDNERGKALAVRVGELRAVLAGSLPSGHVHDSVTLPAADGVPDRAGPGRWIDVTLDSPDGLGTRDGTQALLLPPEGVSVLSDIDDTVKLSEVRELRALLERTFLRPHEAVDGAAARYRAWERAGASFHYVSGSPWQLHATLSAFLQTAGFPRGTLHLREFRWKERSALSMFGEAAAAKRPELEAWLAAHPRRRVVLVGDSGEQDPELYAALARAHPGRVLLIAIRDVSGEDRGSPRYVEAFRDLPDALWLVWTRPEEIPPLEFETAR